MRRFDDSDLKRVVQDRRVWCALGTVSGDIEVLVDDAGRKMVTMDVVTAPGGVLIRARLGMTGSGGAYLGTLPEVGDEVLVAVPNGDFEFEPTIISTASHSDPLDMLSADYTTLYSSKPLRIIAPSVSISHDGVTHEALVRLSDYVAHKHPSGTGPTGTPDNALTAGTKKVTGG